MASAAWTLVGPSALLIVGSAANLGAHAMPLRTDKTWMRRGGFIGVLNGKAKGTSTVRAAAAPAAAPKTAPPSKKIHPIGGQTGKPSPPTPFGKFPKHKPTKLPGPPKSYNP